MSKFNVGDIFDVRYQVKEGPRPDANKVMSSYYQMSLLDKNNVLIQDRYALMNESELSRSKFVKSTPIFKVGDRVCLRSNNTVKGIILGIHGDKIWLNRDDSGECTYSADAVDKIWIG